MSDFLDNMANLSETVKGSLTTMRDLEVKATYNLQEAGKNLDVAEAKSHNKGSRKTAIENAFERGVAQQGAALELMKQKVDIGAALLNTVDDKINSLDKMLLQMKAELIRKGEWPADASGNENTDVRRARHSVRGRPLMRASGNGRRGGRVARGRVPARGTGNRQGK